MLKSACFPKVAPSAKLKIKCFLSTLMTFAKHPWSVQRRKTKKVLKVKGEQEKRQRADIYLWAALKVLASVWRACHVHEILSYYCSVNINLMRGSFLYKSELNSSCSGVVMLPARNNDIVRLCWFAVRTDTRIYSAVHQYSRKFVKQNHMARVHYLIDGARFVKLVSFRHGNLFAEWQTLNGREAHIKLATSTYSIAMPWKKCKYAVVANGRLNPCTSSVHVKFQIFRLNGRFHHI